MKIVVFIIMLFLCGCGGTNIPKVQHICFEGPPFKVGDEVRLKNDNTVYVRFWLVEQVDGDTIKVVRDNHTVYFSGRREVTTEREIYPAALLERKVLTK